MPLTDEQYRLLHLAGTVRLPSPYPATGNLSLAAFDPGNYAAEGAIVLRLTQDVGDRLVVSRLFRLSDLQAARAVWPLQGAVAQAPADPPVRELKFHEEIVRLIVQHLVAFPSDPFQATKASVYLPESAGVVLQTEAAQSAAESYHYYPPTLQFGIQPRECRNQECDRDKEDE